MRRSFDAIVFERPGEIRVSSFELPACGDDELVVETLYTFVSPGTELRILAGTRESAGRFPVIPGYSVVGRVNEVGGAVRGWSVGDLVSGRNPLPLPGVEQLWGGQAAMHRYRLAGQDRPVKLPSGADPWRYVVVEVAAIAWRAVTAAMPGPHERAIVVGQGMIGSFAAWWLLHFGAQVVVLDRVPQRLERARRWGATGAVDARQPDAADRVRSLMSDGADMAIEASATADGIRLAGSLLRQNPQHLLHAAYDPEALRGQAACWPRLVLLATYDDSVTVGPSELFKPEGAIVLQSADRRVGDRMAVVKRVAEGSIRVEDFVGESFSFREAPERYRELRDHPERLSSIAFRWRDG